MNRLGVKVNKATDKKKPMRRWRRKLKNKIKELRKN